MLKRLMKTATALLILILGLFGCQTLRNSGEQTLLPASDDLLRVATYNVHYIILHKETGPWSTGDWARRKGPLDQAFKTINADVISFQEMESFGGGSGGNVNLTLDWLLEQNPDYAAAAVGDASTFPSTQPILFRKDRLTLLDQGWFFFSETPDVIYSRTFNGSYPAYATWAQFRDVTSERMFKVVSIHTDFRSRDNRLRSVELVADRITPWIGAGETVLIAGDLNARHGDQTLEIIEDAGVSFAPVSGSTYHFNRGINLFGAIDHIGFVGDVALARDPIVLRQKFSGEWPTDHYPVIADFKLSD